MKYLSHFLLSFALIGFTALNAYAVAPIITSTGPNNTQINQTYSYQVQANDPEGGALSYYFGFNPANMSVSASGLISWATTPADAGKHAYIITVEDEEQLTAEEYVTISVVDPNNSAPIFGSTPINDTYTNALYQFDAQATDPDGDAIEYSISSWPEAPGLSIDSNGVVNWTPDLGQIGEYWVWITANDLKFGVSQLSFELRVTDQANNSPVIFNKSQDVVVNVGQPFVYDLQASDADGDVLNYALQIWPEVSGSTISAAGVVEWTPGINNVEDHFVIVNVDDGKLGEDSHSFKLVVVNTGNTPPSITSSPITSVEVNGAYQYDVDATDPENNTLTFALIAFPNGMTIDAVTGLIDWAPSTVGDVSVEVAVDDGINPVVTQTYTLIVTPPANTAPTVNDASISTNEDNAIAIILQASDAESDPLTYNVLTNPVSGNLSGVAPNLIYTPNVNSNGLDQFTFQVNDGAFDSNISTVTIDVAAINDAPTAQAQTLSTDEDTPRSIILVGGDAENSPLSYVVDTQPASGVLSGFGANVIYTPNANFSGIDSFSYHVNDGELDSSVVGVVITVNAINDAPIAQSQTINTNEDSAISVTLVGIDPEGDALTFTLVNSTTNGTITGTLPSLTYTPDPNFFGNDQLTFQVTDGSQYSNTAIVDFTVVQINDAPVANAQSVSVNEDTPANISLSGSDEENSSLTFVVDTQPTHGVLSGAGANISYTPNINFSGNDTFTFHVNDGELDSASVGITLTVNEINDAPIAQAQLLITNEDVDLEITLGGSDPENDPLTFTVDTHPANGTLSGSAPNLIYTPNADANGDDQFSFSVSDGELDSGVAIVSIDVQGVNDAPTISSTPVALSTEGQYYSYQVLAQDIDGDTLNYTLTSAAQGMSIDVESGLIQWPSPLVGNHLVVIAISDGELEATQTYMLSVSKANEAPIITSTPVYAAVDGEAYKYSVVAEDPDGDALSYRLVNAPAGISFDTTDNSINWNQAVLGSYNITVEVIDPSGLFAQQIYVIHVVSVLPPTTTKGQDFWAMFNTNLTIDGGPIPKLALFMVSEIDTEVTVTIPGLSFSEVYEVSADQVHEVDLTSEFPDLSFVHTLGVSTYGIHVTALADINLYLISDGTASSDSTQIFPTNSLDNEYLIVGDSDGVGSRRPNGGFQYGNYVGVVATQDNTTLEITPLIDLFVDDSNTVVTAGNTYTITLNSGETFQGLGPDWMTLNHGNKDTDISGSSVVSDKPVAVFSGDKCIAIKSVAACDHIVEQIPPTSSWGVNYMTMPLAARIGGDRFKIVSAYDNNYVWVNDQLVANLQKGEFHTVTLDAPSSIRANLPIVVAQFSHSNGYDQNDPRRELPAESSDPFMVLVPPREQFLASYTFATPSEQVGLNFISLIVASDDLDSIRLDGNILNGIEWEAIPDTQYMGAHLMVEAGQHTVTADSKFGFTVYGFDYFVSYGHIGGQGLADLSTASELITSASTTSPHLGESVCFNAQLLDADRNPISQNQMMFVRDYNGLKRFYSQITDVTGHASFCYETEAEGVETVTVSAQGLSETITVNWQPESAGRLFAPTFYTLPEMGATPGETYHYQALARDPNNDAITYSLVGAPTDMTIDATTGLVEWQVPRNFDRTQVSIVASDGTYNVSQAYELRYTQRSNRYPDFTSVPITRTFSDREYRYNMLADDPDSYLNTVTYSIVSGPEGMVIDDISRPAIGEDLVWFPTSADVGDHVVTVQMMDAGGFTANQSFTLTVDLNQTPVFISTPPAEVSVGHDWFYSFEIEDNEEDNPFPHTYALISGPEGMSVNYSGYARWFPSLDQIGSHDVEITVQDPSGAIDTQVFTVTVVANGIPEFTTIPSPAAVARHDYNSPIVASDADGDALSYSVSAGPAGLRVVPGSVRWTPTDEQIGTHEVSITATDPYGASATYTYTLNVTPNAGPTFTSAPVLVGVSDHYYTYNAAATDPEGDYVRYRLATAPSGMAIGGANIRWTPSFSQVGSHSVVLEAYDSLGGVTQQSFTLTIAEDQAPIFTTTPDTVAYIGATYSYRAIASDPDGDMVHFRKLSGPASLSIINLGYISWRPLAIDEGRQTVVIEAYNPLATDGAVSSQTFDVTVIGDSLKIVDYPQNAVLHHAQAWQGEVSAIHPNELPISYSLTSSVPEGLSLDSSTGVLTWVPGFTQIGNHSITVSATDENGQEDSATFSLTVQEGENQAPVVDSEAIVMAYTGEIYEYPLQVSDPENQSLIYELLLGPDGMSIDSEGVLVWLPEVNDVGIHTVTIRIADSEGAETLHSFDLRVSQERDYPFVISEPITEARTEDGYSYQIQARDPEGDPLTYSVIDAPLSLVIDSSGLVTWSPSLNDVGEYSVMFGISDDNGFVTEHQYEIQVTAPGPHNRRICR